MRRTARYLYVYLGVQFLLGIGLLWVELSGVSLHDEGTISEAVQTLWATQPWVIFIVSHTFAAPFWFLAGHFLAAPAAKYQEIRDRAAERKSDMANAEKPEMASAERRRPENAALRAAVDDTKDSVIGTLLASPQAKELEASLIQKLVDAIFSGIARLLHRQPVVPAPAPAPAPTVPVVPPAPVPAPSSAPTTGPKHRINGGTAKVTGIQEGLGAAWDPNGDIIDKSIKQWVELDEARVDQICAGTANAPNVCRIMTDDTPSAEDGYVFGPKDKAWEDDPQPGSVEDPNAEPMRLVWESDTNQIYLTHEYHDYGNRNWIRCSVTPGTGAEIRNPHYVGPRYPGSPRFAQIPLTRKGKVITLIHVGRGA